MPRDFRLSWISFLTPLSVSLEPFRVFFQKFMDIFAAQGALVDKLTLVATGKIFNQKSFNYFVWTPLATLRCRQSDIVPVIGRLYQRFRWYTSTCDCLREFSNKFEMTLILGVWGRWFMKKTWSIKSRDTVHLTVRMCDRYFFCLVKQGQLLLPVFFPLVILFSSTSKLSSVAYQFFVFIHLLKSKSWFVSGYALFSPFFPKLTCFKLPLFVPGWERHSVESQWERLASLSCADSLTLQP